MFGRSGHVGEYPAASAERLKNSSPVLVIGFQDLELAHEYRNPDFANALTQASVRILARIRVPADLRAEQMFVHVKGKGTSNSATRTTVGWGVPFTNFKILPKERFMPARISIRHDGPPTPSETPLEWRSIAFELMLVNGLDVDVNSGPFHHYLILRKARKSHELISFLIDQRRGAVGWTFEPGALCESFVRSTRRGIPKELRRVGEIQILK